MSVRIASILVSALAGFVLIGTRVHAAPMDFRLSASAECPAQGCIVASGEIDPESVTRFSRLLKASSIEPGALVVFNSPGGDLASGLKLGMLIRRAGLHTRVQAVDARTDAWFPGARCASACAYAFLGGRVRTVPLDGAYGIHQFKAGTGAKDISLARSQRLAASILDYLDAVQVSPRLASEALKTESHRVRWLAPGELSALGVVANAE